VEGVLAQLEYSLPRGWVVDRVGESAAAAAALK